VAKNEELGQVLKQLPLYKNTAGLLVILKQAVQVVEEEH
jgi:hypothetical protein